MPRTGEFAGVTVNSWGGKILTETLRLSYTDKTGRERKENGKWKPSFYADLVYTIDPVFYTPGLEKHVPKYSNSIVKSDSGSESPGVWGSFGKWQNWYQVTDAGRSNPLGIVIWGSIIDAPNVTNTEVKKFNSPASAHVDIVMDVAIRNTIGDGIESLRSK